MALKAVANNGGISGLTLAGNTFAANPTAATGPAQAVPAGDVLSGGIFFNAAGEAVGTPPTTYYLTKVPDDSGFTGTTIVGASQPYYSASRTPSALSETTVTGTLSAGPTTVANYVTAINDPGAFVLPPGNVECYPYCSVGAGGVATVTVTVDGIAPDGTLQPLFTGTSASFSNTSPAGIKVHLQKLAATALTNVVYDRLVYIVRATRISGPVSFAFTLTSDGATNRSTATSPILGNPSLLYGVYDVRALGGVADGLTFTDAIMTAGTATLASATATFGQQDVGKPIWVDGAGVGGLSGAPFASTIASVTNTHTITCAGTADTTTSGIQTLSGAVVDISGATGYMLPGVDTIAVVGGTSTITAVLNVVSTQINPPTDTTPAVAIVSPGSGGTPGSWKFQTTTDTGTPADIRVIIDSTGVATSVSLIHGGLFLTNPGTAAEPLVNLESGLTGLTISIASIGVRTVTVNNPGAYTVLPAQPPDSFATGAGSTSGATGCTLVGAWSGSGQYMYGTNMRTALDTAQTLAATTDANSRAIIRLPAGIYVLDGAVTQTMTRPILIEGDGPNQTLLLIAPTYAGPHIFGWSDLFPSGTANPITGNVGAATQSEVGWGVRNLTVAGFRSSANRQSALIDYDRCDSMTMDGFQVRYLNGAALKTGSLGTTKSSFLRECTFNNNYFRNCGDDGFPVIDLDSVGTTAGDNFITFNDTNVVFPVGPGVAIRNHTTKRDGVKTIYFNGLRIERAAGLTAFGDEFQIGSTTDLNAITNVYGTNVHLIGAGSGVSGLALYGMTEKTRPHDIEMNGLLVNGPVLGTGVSIFAGYNIYINAAQLEGRTASLATGNHSNYRATTTAVAGSTSSTVKTVASPNGAAGMAVVLTIPGQMVVGQSGTLLTVSAVNSGRVDTGSYVTTTGFGVESILTLGSGTGGTGTYNMSLSQTIAPGTTLDFLFIESRNAVSSTTTTTTIGALQGSAATWTHTPANGDSISFQSLVDGDLLINGNGQEKSYTYNLGQGVAALLNRPLQVFGQADLPGTIPDDLTFTGDVKFTIGSNVTATGTNQAGAYVITKAVTIFDTVAPGAGAVLPPWLVNDHRKIINRGANSLLLYPASGGQIEALGTNTAGSILAGGASDFWADTTNLWRVT